jgi:hypothetical protein
VPEKHRLPRWAWLLPPSSAIAAILAWTVWCGTARGTWIGGVLICLTGVFAYALALEGLPRRRRGVVAAARRTGLAIGLGIGATGVTFLAAGIGYYFCCRPFG